jgi:hypothetical protein
MLVAECRYPGRHILIIVLLNVVMLNVIMLSVLGQRGGI